jgi:integrase
MTAVTPTTTRTLERRKLAFTPFALKRLPIPASGQVDYWDNSQPGFGLRISAKGTRTWVGMTRLLGHPNVTRFTLGRAAAQEHDGGLTLAQARSEWLALKTRIMQGEDPRLTEAHEQAVVIQRSAQTFLKTVEEFLRVHHPKKKTVLRPATLRRYTGLLLGPDMAGWHARPLTSMTRKDVIALLDRMQQRGVMVSANRALAVLKKFFSWAIQHDRIEHSPCDHIHAPAAETPRARHLFGSALYARPSELALLWRACEHLGPLGALPKLLMLTGQRLSEVAQMRADEVIDLDGVQPRWHIPGSRTKNGKDHVVPLTPMAVKILNAIPHLVSCPFIFSTTGTSPMSGFTNFKKRIDRALATLKQHDPTRYEGQFKDGWVLHDLRRTFKTGLAELGISSDIRDALVNHAPQGVEAHYNHAEHDAAKRAALLKWEAHIMGLLKADEGRATKRK